MWVPPRSLDTPPKAIGLGWGPLHKSLNPLNASSRVSKLTTELGVHTLEYARHSTAIQPLLKPPTAAN